MLQRVDPMENVCYNKMVISKRKTDDIQRFSLIPIYKEFPPLPQIGLYIHLTSSIFVNRYSIVVCFFPYMLVNINSLKLCSLLYILIVLALILKPLKFKSKYVYVFCTFIVAAVR